MKWQKEQEDFFRRKREHDLQLVKIEKQEIQKRDQKMKQKRKDLEEKRQKNLMIQDDITIQVFQIKSDVSNARNLKNRCMVTVLTSISL